MTGPRELTPCLTCRALTLEEVLKKLCRLCLRKQKGLEIISPTYLGLIKKYNHADYLSSGKFPQVICPGCKAFWRDGRRSEENGSSLKGSYQKTSTP